MAGTIEAFETYDESDLIATWYAQEKGDSIVGESWSSDYDAEYVRKAIRGWGKFYMLSF